MSKEIEIIGLSSKIGCGKNYVGEKILYPMLLPKNTAFIAFADHFKVDSVVKANLKYEDVFHKKTESSRMELQKIGNDTRERFSKDIWVNILKTWIRVYQERGINRFFVMDVRYKNEADAILGLGGKLIRLEAPKRNKIKLLQETEGNEQKALELSKHISETDMDDYDKSKYSLILDNDFNDNLFNIVRDYVRTLEVKNELLVFTDLDDTISTCSVHYLNCINKLLDVLSIYKNDYLTNVEFEIFFKKAYDEIEGNYHIKNFTHDRFPNSLVNITKEMFKYMILDKNSEDSLINKAREIGYGVFNVTPKPIGKAVEVLKKISEKHKIVIVTQGDRLEQMKKIVSLGINDYVEEVFTTHNKSVDIYTTLMDKYPSEKYIMVGDNKFKDIINAIEGNVNHVFWVGGDADEAEKISENITCIDKFEDLEKIILN